MRDLFSKYIVDLYQDVPTCVYEGLFSLYCLGSVVLFATRGFSKGLKLSAGLLAIEYVLLIYCSTVIFRPAVDVFGYNFIPFWSYEAIENGKKYLLAENIMNMVVFVPVGALLSGVSRRLKWWMVLLIGFGMSLSIESLQFVLKRGFSEFDDVFHNTLGCAIGVMIVEIFKGVWKFCAFLFVPQWGRQTKDAGILESRN